MPAYLQIIRPVNVIITAAAVMVGGVISGGQGVMALPHLWLAALSAALVAAGGNAINDAYDAGVDRINRPGRPVPSGRITVRQAGVLGGVLLVVGTVTGFVLALRLGLTALLVSVLLLAYSDWWQRTPLWGNVVVAFCGALPLVYGALAVGGVGGGIVPGLFAFMVHLSREIIKDIEDLIGDRAQGARTLPVVVGEFAARRVASFLILLTVLLTPMPYLAGICQRYYLILVVPFADLPLLYASWGIWSRGDRATVGQASVLLKFAMIGGLAALYAG